MNPIIGTIFSARMLVALLMGFSSGLPLLLTGSVLQAWMTDEGVDLGEAFAALWARPLEAEPMAMDLALAHPATDEDVTTLAERIS